MLLEGFGDETNPKLCLQAEYVILRRAYSEKGHDTGVQLKNVKIKHFLLKSRIFGPKSWFFALLSCTPVACPFSEKAR